MNIGLSAETTCDLTPELKKELDLNIVPFTVLLGDKQYFDGEISIQNIFDFVSKNKVLPKTSAVNEYQYTEHFNKLLKRYDAIIHISISGDCSSAVENAKKVASNMKNVYVIDSRSLSTGISLLLFYAKKLIDKNIEVTEIVNKVNAEIKNVNASFVLDKLDYLYRGGRCNALQLLGANLLKLHPEIIMEGGKNTPYKKVRGNISTVVSTYCDDILSHFSNPDKNIAFVTHANAPQEIIDIAYNKLKTAGFKRILTTTAGCTVASHCGPNCIGILYINNSKISD